uniref:tetratricopeptide repeat protein 24 n=1 Tax=Monopterus albus TaxID=43700 RepID=UPI0009B4402E|nr:tetratricopeptide repeat protein 24 [Monopterus albus]
MGYHRLAAGLYGSLGCRGDQARCFSNLAFACSRLGDEEEAAESFIHALQGFRDTEDHLAQMQVCESLAECYLKQKKQHKAVQLYKEALSALSHCKDTSGTDRDRLVERLTAALQQSLTISLQRPHPFRARPPKPHSHSLAVGPGVRKFDMTQTQGRADEQRGQEPGAEQEPISRQEAAEHCGSAVGRANEKHEHISTAPGLNRSSDLNWALNHKLEPVSTITNGVSVSSTYHSDQLQHSELWSDRMNHYTNSRSL